MSVLCSARVCGLLLESGASLSMHIMMTAHDDVLLLQPLNRC